MTPPLSAPFISAPLLLAGVCFFVRRHRLRLERLALWPQFEHNGTHTCPVLNAHRASWCISLAFISRRIMSVGALFWGRHPWVGSQRPETVCGLRCFAAVGRQLLRTMVSSPSVSLTLREETLTWCMKYLALAWVVRTTTRAQRDPCAPALSG